MNTDFWLNGLHLGTHPDGYTSFWFDITGYVAFGERNILAVKVINEARS